MCLLASGSRGNSTLIETDGFRLLVDAGLSGIETERRLASIGLAGADLDAILVTHEHHDHVSGIGPLARRYQLPVHIEIKTHSVLPKLGKIQNLQLFQSGDEFDCHKLKVTTFATTHDAVSPVGFIINSSEGKIGYATDLGMPTRLVAEMLKGCRVVILEANHDEQMLWDGPYPWPLKQRIRSRHGHLSNGETRQLLEQIAWPGLDALFLAHLSEENNCPVLVADFISESLAAKGFEPRIIIGQQQQASSCFVGALL